MMDKKEELKTYTKEFIGWLKKDKPEISNIEKSFEIYLNVAFQSGVVLGNQEMYNKFLSNLERIKK